MHWIRDFSRQHVEARERNVDNDAPREMRGELVDFFFRLAIDSNGQVQPRAIYEATGLMLGAGLAANPYGGYPARVSRDIGRADWWRVYDWISRLWQEFERSGLADQFREGVKDFIACLEKSTIAHPTVEEALAIKQQHLPKRIYKYRQVCPYHINNLETDTVWLSSPESFNDPYDCWLTLADNLVSTLIERRLLDAFVKANKLQTVLPPAQIEEAKNSLEPLKTLAGYLPSSSAAAIKLKQKAENYSISAEGLANGVVSTLQEWRKMVKLCSFSAIKDSLLMWGHYADNHRGFCLEYDLEALNADHSFRKNLYPVVYSHQLYGLRQYAEKLVAPDRQEFCPMLPLLAMIHKFHGWKYEEEWRMIFEKEVVTADHDQPAPTPSRIPRIKDGTCKARGTVDAL